MSLAELAIKRPTFITCTFILILALGVLAWTRLSVALYPQVSFPIVTITVPYAGTSPQDMETLVSMPIEDELSRLAGVKTLRSINQVGVATVVAEFSLDTDVRFAEQKINQIISRIRGKLPADILEPLVQTIDPSDSPVATLSLTADLPEGELFDLADQEIKPRLEQLKQVALVEIEGARKREIHVLLDAGKLKAHEMSATEVAERLGRAGLNVPVGKFERRSLETLIRTQGEFDSLKVIEKTIVRFVGNEVAISLGEVGHVEDGLEDEKTRTYINGKRALSLSVYRQSGANTVTVADDVIRQLAKINADLRPRVAGFNFTLVRDGAKAIRESVSDVSVTIALGIALTIVVVLFFLGSIRSTLITGIALPTSLLGALFLMWLVGFTANITTLTALSLAVGLLIDDAIVVRENIFRRIEAGEEPRVAATLGTAQVTLAVVATTLSVVSVFGPIAFLQGLIGQFFKQFGLTICFAMLISLFDSLTMAPMLSTYFAGQRNARDARNGFVARIQSAQQRAYLKLLAAALKRPLTVMGAAAVVFFASISVFQVLPKTFLPTQESGEFLVSLDMPAGTSMNAMDRLATQLDVKIRAHREVRETLLTTGGRNGEANQAVIVVLLAGARQRDLSTSQMKDVVRRDATAFSAATIKVQDVAQIGSGSQTPFTLNLIGQDLNELKATADALVAHLKKSPDLQDADTSFRAGAPELHVALDKQRSEEYGVSSAEVGHELRTLVTGVTPARYREKNREYDIRVRLEQRQQDLLKMFTKVLVPNVNNKMIPLAAVSKLVEAQGPATINRQDRGRYIQISAEINPTGKGLSKAIQDTRQLIDSGTVALPRGARYQFVGQTQDFQELLASMALTVVLAIGFMYLILASLYESFLIPFSIMLVLPLAACGALYALWLTGFSVDIYSMIGCILLLGVAAKNSILLVDAINQGRRQGLSPQTSVIEAGKMRFRPIMMTSFALIAGMLPVAAALTESSRQRSS